jgi:hypothetical protein
MTGFDPKNRYIMHGFDKDGKPIITWGSNYKNKEPNVGE